MKLSSSTLVTMALLAVAALSAPGVDADRYFVPIHGHLTGDSYSYQPIYINKPHRSLRSTDSSKQGPLDDGKKPQQQQHRLPKKDVNLQGPRALTEGGVASPVERALGQSPVTPAPTTTKHATPTPTKPYTPKPTTSTSKATPAPTNTKSNKMHAPTVNTPKSTPTGTKKTVVKSTPPPTATNASKPLSGAQLQQKRRNLGDNQAKQQPPHNHKHNDSPARKDSGKQQ